MTDLIATQVYHDAPPAALTGDAVSGGPVGSGISAAFLSALAAQVPVRAAPAPIIEAGRAVPDAALAVAGANGKLPAPGTILPPGAAAGLTLAPSHTPPTIAPPAAPDGQATANAAMAAAAKRSAIIERPAPDPAAMTRIAAGRHGQSLPDRVADQVAAAVGSGATPIVMNPAIAMLAPATPPPPAPSRQPRTIAASLALPDTSGGAAGHPQDHRMAAAVAAATSATAAFPPAGARSALSGSGPAHAGSRAAGADVAAVSPAIVAAVATGGGSAAGSPPVAAAPVPAATQDFAALVDRLVDARIAARSGDAPQSVAATVATREFGKVSLDFRYDTAGLSVAMSSADPGFASAATGALAAVPPLAAAARTDGAGHPGGNPADHGRRSPDAPAPPGMGTAGAPTGNSTGNQAATPFHSPSHPPARLAPLRTVAASSGDAALADSAPAPVAGIFA